jgi:hypothetical protein
MPEAPMPDLNETAVHFLACLDASVRGKHPYRHWLLEDILPARICAGIDALPFAPPDISDTKGRRETNNSTRQFFAASERAQFPVCEELASALQSEDVTRSIENECDVSLHGASLRIEYCLDTDGFWLEPHTDIGAKRFTMLIYLSQEPGSEAWGTDILDANMQRVATAPYRRNCGLIFIPATDTWHGFARRPIEGVRRSLIVNYVGPEWRARHELAYPEQPVLA